METSLIIDANNLLHRVWWVSNQSKQDMVVTHFLNSLKKYIKQFKPDRTYMAWDKKLKPKIKNFRQLATEVSYKGNREYNRDVYNHESLIIDLCRLLGVKNMYPGVLEGDDVISWLTGKLKGERVIVSVDQDFIQLAEMDNVSIYNPMKNVTHIKESIFDTFGVSADQFLSYKALIGDKSDNIPGIPRVGKKTAIKIISSGIDSLSEDHRNIYEKNLMLMNLNESYNHHEGEVDVYESQFQELDGDSLDLDLFFNLCDKNNLLQITKNKAEWRTAFNNKQYSLVNIINSIGKY